MFQVSILKVLASHPDGHASLDAIKADMKILMAAGQDWSKQMKRLSAHAPSLNVFSDGFVTRKTSGWAITESGRAYLKRLQSMASDTPDTPSNEPSLESDAPVMFVPERIVTPQKRAAFSNERRKPNRRGETSSLARYG